MDHSQAEKKSPWSSTIVKKAIMAVTGLIWIGFVTFHMYGNLKIFVGAEYFNAYAEGLRHLGAPLFGRLHLLTVMRSGLIVAIVLHVWSAISLTRQARAARTTRYAVTRRMEADYAAITMRYGGTMIALFLLYHLADLTWGVAAVSPDFIKHDAYANVLASFQSAPVVGFYMVALVALGLHLYHGTWSLFQTLGLLDRRTDLWVRRGALALAIVVVVGFAVVPLSVLFGYVT